MRITLETATEFAGTHKGAEIWIQRDRITRDGYRYHITVTARDGGHLYFGYAPESVQTMSAAKREAINGACLGAAKVRA